MLAKALFFEQMIQVASTTIESIHLLNFTKE